MNTPNRNLRRALLSAGTAMLLLVLPACGGPDTDDGTAPAPVTTLVDVVPAVSVPNPTDSGTQVDADVTVRTSEPDGVRVWLLPYANDGEELPTFYYAGSPLEDGPELTVERYFRVIVGDEDGDIAGFRVVARNADRDVVLDERVPNPVRFRSLATTHSLTLAPSSGTLRQGERVDVQVAFELDSERDVQVSVHPIRGSDFDGAWSYSQQNETFTGVTSGTMTGWFSVDEEVDGTAPVGRVRIEISDLADGPIYWRYVDADLAFTEPAP